MNSNFFSPYNSRKTKLPFKPERHKMKLYFPTKLASKKYLYIGRGIVNTIIKWEKIRWNEIAMTFVYIFPAYIVTFIE